MEKVKDEIKSRVNILKEKLEQHKNKLLEIDSNIKAFKNEKIVTVNNFYTLSGAIQAYEESNRLSSECSKECSNDSDWSEPLDGAA